MDPCSFEKEVRVYTRIGYKISHSLSWIRGIALSPLRKKNDVSLGGLMDSFVATSSLLLRRHLAK